MFVITDLLSKKISITTILFFRQKIAKESFNPIMPEHNPNI